MLPDFPEVKAAANKMFMNAVRKRIKQHSPILDEVRHSRIHEGRRARLTREDESSDEISFEKVGAELMIPRDQMKRVTAAQLLEHIDHLAEQLAQQQTELMFGTITAAVEEVGNAISAAEIGNREAFLEMNRRLEVDFDPDTLEPKNQIIVLHPSQVESFVEQAKEWEKDPDFVAEMKRIREKQIEEWRARENRRKLVD